MAVTFSVHEMFTCIFACCNYSFSPRFLSVALFNCNASLCRNFIYTVFRKKYPNRTLNRVKKVAYVLILVFINIHSELSYEIFGFVKTKMIMMR